MSSSVCLWSESIIGIWTLSICPTSNSGLSNFIHHQLSLFAAKANIFASFIPCLYPVHSTFDPIIQVPIFFFSWAYIPNSKCLQTSTKGMLEYILILLEYILILPKISRPWFYRMPRATEVLRFSYYLWYILISSSYYVYCNTTNNSKYIVT